MEEITANQKKKVIKGLWVRPLFEKRNRNAYGAANNIIPEMRSIKINKHENYFRMNPKMFDKLLSLVEPHIQKVDIRREPIPVATRLAVTLRYLAAGDSMTSLSYSFRVGLSTISEIISETTLCICNVLEPLILAPPNEEEWLQIARGFEKTWQFPNCVGAIDGKHVQIQAPPNAGSEFYNYKGTHSVVILAVVDYKYLFRLVDIGAQGRQSDGGIFSNSAIGRKLKAKTLEIPQPRIISPGRPFLPFVILGDEAFPLMENLLRPYPGRGGLTLEQRVYNYRHSRARRVSENAFGILVSRWRILSKPIIAKLENIENIIKATICLHNFVMMDSPGSASCLLEERKLVRRMGTNTYTSMAKTYRDHFKDYLNEEGSVPWQWDNV